MSVNTAQDGSALDAVVDPDALIDQPPGPRDFGPLTSLAIGWTVILALYFGRVVLVPIALAVLLSFILTPVVRVLRRIGINRVVAVLLAVFFALSIILSLGGVIGMQASEVVSEIPVYAGTIDRKVAKLREIATGSVSSIVNGLTSRLPRATTTTPPPAPHNAPDVANRPLPVEIHQPDPTPLELAGRLLPPVASPLATIAMVFVVAIFILLQQADVRDRMIRLFGLQDLHRTTRALDDAAQRLTRYLLAQLAVNTLFGVIVAIGLAVIGVPNPMLWGALGALFRFVPYIGSVLCAVLPIALAAAVDPGWNMAIYTALLFIVTEILMGQFLDPFAFGRSTGLSPLSVVIAAIFWTWMWGPVGLPLSVPLTVCLVVLGRHVKQLEFLDVLMGDRPALTPVERFCQRILANDPEEALENAEESLKDHSLLAYYDDVVIRGLQLAATDVERSARGTALLARIRRAMTQLIGALEGIEDDGQSEQNVETARSVLCVPLGEPLDRVVCDILVQLAKKQGLRTRIAPFSMTHDVPDADDASGVSFICVCGLDLSLNPMRSRYLVRRIRRIAPEIPILALLLPRSAAGLNAEQLQRQIGADRVATSLREALDLQSGRSASTEPYRLFPATAAC